MKYLLVRTTNGLSVVIYYLKNKILGIISPGLAKKIKSKHNAVDYTLIARFCQEIMWINEKTSLLYFKDEVFY